MSTQAHDIESRYFSGAELFGDDFDQAQIDAWYEAEKEGYADLGTGEHGSAETYGRNAFNIHHLFGHLPAGQLGDAVGIGASYGGEFIPIIDRLNSLTILEPSESLRSETVRGLPVKYVMPQPDGVMPFDDATFDLVSCLGTLHHIPNVSTVMAEMSRVLRPGGYAVVREPIHSMGDWRKPRPGLTSRERGIPLPIFRRLADENFEVVRSQICDFPVTDRLPNPHGRVGVLFDQVVSRAFAWNYRYHATSSWEKLRPRSLALVLRKA